MKKNIGGPELMKRNKISRSVSQVFMPIMVDKMKGEGVNGKKLEGHLERHT